MRDNESRLSAAIEEVRGAHLDGQQMTGSAQRVAERLGIDAAGVYAGANASVIENCEDVRALLGAYRSATLPGARMLVVEAHLRDCGACQRQYRSGTEATTVDWSAPDRKPRKAKRALVWRPRALGWAWAPTLALLTCTFFVYKAFWQVPPGVRAEVISIDGAAYRSLGAYDHPLVPGDKLAEGERVRTTGGGHTVLRLADGSTVEMNERSVLGIGARGRNVTLSLDNGAVIVQATKRTSGHLYVDTPDCRVAVTGTVFSVNSGIKGSRVGVLQGSVHVAHAGLDTVVDAGNQMATSDKLNPTPLGEQIAWSHDRERLLPLLAQLSSLQLRIGKIPFPQPRYSSDLLERVPSDTLLYVTIPNLGNFLSEANGIFHEQLKQSPELQAWWNRGHDHDTAQIDAMVEKLHQISQFLGDEVVIVGIKPAIEAGNPGLAVVADVRKGGLDALLKSEFSGNANGSLLVLDQQSLATAPESKERTGGFALVREHEVIFSNSTLTLKQLNARLNAGSSGFAAGEFGKQIQAAYGRGAGVILAADLHQMLGAVHPSLASPQKGEAALQKSGMDGVKYLIAEHRESNGVPENHLNIEFAGTRQRVASWLGAPAPMRSLEFVTPNASIVAAVLSKEPKNIADDILNMAEPGNDAGTKNWNDAEAALHINLRNDLAANLGGEFLLSVDGPVLPTPSWKAVIEVHDADHLEQTMEQIAQVIREHATGKDSHGIQIESSEVDSQRFYAVKEVASGTTVANYTFADGYMIMAPTRALLLQALRAQTTGDSLARSTSFKALLPRDANENYSAIAYQNLSPVIAPLLTQLSGDSADALRKLSADARPTAICAWGRDSRIEAASDSRLFGFDFLTLGTLLTSRNKLAAPGVQD